MTAPNRTLPPTARRELLHRLYRDVLLRPPSEDASNTEVNAGDYRAGHDDARAGTRAPVESATNDPSAQLDHTGEDSCALYQRAPSAATPLASRGGGTCRSG